MTRKAKFSVTSPESGNSVLNTLGLSTEEVSVVQVKSLLWHAIKDQVVQRGMTLRQVGTALNLSKGRVESFFHGQLSLFLVEDLMRYALILGFQMELKLKTGR